jgi:hypothetical protein
MTLPQIWNCLFEGKVPRPGKKTATFEGPTALADARAWREEQKVRAEIARERALFEEHKVKRKATRGF